MKQNNKKGFTLIELLVSLFIFTIVMVTVLYVFAQTTKNFRYVEAQQRNVENAQYALNLAAKVMRTSTLTTNIQSDEFFVFDHSQGSCVRFLFNQLRDPLLGTDRGVFQMQTEPASDPAPCGNRSYYSGSPEVLTTGNVSGEFLGVMTERDDPNTRVANEMHVGHVTIIMTVGDIGEKQMNLQTSVSLRDYPVELSF